MKMTRRDFNKVGLGALSLAALGRPAWAGELIRKPIPSSGEMVPVIGLGTNRYGQRDRDVLLASQEHRDSLGDISSSRRGPVFESGLFLGVSENPVETSSGWLPISSPIRVR